MELSTFRALFRPARPIQELVNGLGAVKAVPGPFWCADVADGVPTDDALGHLVGQSLGVLEADQTAKLAGVNPVALGLTAL